MKTTGEKGQTVGRLDAKSKSTAGSTQSQVLSHDRRKVKSRRTQRKRREELLTTRMGGIVNAIHPAGFAKHVLLGMRLSTIGLRKIFRLQILLVIYPSLVRGVFYQVNYSKLPDHVISHMPCQKRAMMVREAENFSKNL